MRDAPSAILIHEYITGGSWPADQAPPRFMGEAAALSRSVAASFMSWGRFPVVMTRDARFGATPPPADEVVTLAPADSPETLTALARRCGAALILAPETRGALEAMSAMVERAGVLLLGSPADAVAVTADKGGFAERLRAAGLPTPRTMCVAAAAAPAAAAELGYPVVVKPVRGAGCDGVARVDDAAQLRDVVRDLGVGVAEPFLLQEHVDGVAASVSLLVAGGRARVLALNSQDVSAGTPYEYRGGVSGIGHRRAGEARRLARAAVLLVPGLRGFVGVDLVIGSHGCSIIEVNARVTTSFVGLSRALDLNVAEAVWRACREGRLPERVRVRRPVGFTVETVDVP